VADDLNELGARLRALRSEKGLSLSAVAEATGISASFLSLVETGKNDITFGRLRRLIDFYDVTLAALLPPPDDPVVIRASEHRHLRFPSEGIDVFVLVPGDANDRLYASLAVWEPGSQVEPLVYDGVVLITVLAGAVLLELAGSAPVELGPGDAAYFNATRGHRICTGPEEGARFLFVAAPPPFAASHHPSNPPLPAA
jgi:transcriptional regulator with XRE-family HTH domain